MKIHFLIVALTGLIATHAGAVEVGEPAPPLDARLLDGAPFSLSAAKGKVVIVNFWASWCEPCRAEMPALDAYYRKHQAEGLVLLAISMDDAKDETKAREVMRAFGFSAAFAREAGYKKYGRIWRIPITFVVDRQGILRKVGWFGDPGIDAPLLEAAVTPLLQGK